MVRTLLGLILFVPVFSPWSFAQTIGPGTKAAPADDIRSTASTTSGKVNAWIGRNGLSAVVLKIENPVSGSTTIPGKLSQYIPSTHGLDQYELQATTLVQSTGNVSSDRVDIELELAGDKRGYKTFVIYAKGKKTEGALGWVAFRPGTGDRTRSRTLIRLNRGKIKDASGTATNDPCDGPPTDDIGEEELFEVDPDATNQPSKTVSKTPNAAVVAQ
jgi:hypothetical protein